MFNQLAQDESKHGRRSGMLSLSECIDYLKTWDDEIDPLAHHQYAPKVLAAEMDRYLTESGGESMLVNTIIDDISYALAAEDFQQTGRLLAVIRHFVETHRDHPNEYRKDSG